MKITRQNYEPFFIDFLEGRMLLKEKKELMIFLERNPDLRKELEEYNEIVVPADEALFFDKEGLKKGGHANEINKDNFEQFCIAAAENDLESRKKDELIKYIGEDKLKKGIFNLYCKIRLEPEKNILFDNKKFLYAPKTFNITRRRRAFALISAAASVIILLSLFFMLETPEPSGISETVVPPDAQLPEPVIRSQATHEVVTPQAVTNIPSDEWVDQIARIDPEIVTTYIVQEKTGFDDVQFPSPFPLISDRYEMIKIESLPPAALASASVPEIQVLPAYMQMYDGRVNTDERENQPLSIQGFAGQLTAGLINPDKIPVIGEEGVSLWQIADAGIKGFSRITGKEVHFEKETDQEGRVVAFVFESGNFGISRVKGKN